MQVLLVNIFGGAVIIIFSFLSILLLYTILRHFNLHRVTAREEKIGKMIATISTGFYPSPIILKLRIRFGFGDTQSSSL